MNLFGTLSYATAAVGFLVLTLLLGTSWKGRNEGVRLIVASAMTCVWATVLALYAWTRAPAVVMVHTVEVLRDGAWLIALLGLARGIVPRWMGVLCHVLWVGFLLAGWSLAGLQTIGATDMGAALIFGTGGILVAVAVFVLLEQIYRNASAQGRYGFKFLAIGLGGVFAYDLFLYSQAELLRGISEDLWSARGFVNALLAPLIAIAARRNPHWSLDVFVSRQVVVFTTAVMAVGIYLLVMAAGGYYVRQIGGTWGDTAKIVFFVGALAVLGVVVMSGTVRRRLRVFVSKHFYRNKYDYRIEWLRFVETLANRNEEDVRRTSLKAIAQIFDSPGAVMYVRGESGRYYEPAAAWPMRTDAVPGLERLPADHELVQFIQTRHWVVDLAEFAETPEIYQNIDIPAWLSGLERLRVIAPLLQSDGLAGIVLLYEPPPPFELTFEDRDLLKTLGRHVATIVAQYDADRKLAESRQFEAYHRLTAFMMHDLKNAVAQLQLVVTNAERHRNNPAFIDDAIETIGNAVQRMTRLIQQLRDSERRPATVEVEVVPLVEELLQRCTNRRPVPILEAPVGAGLAVRADADRLCAALEHLVRNAQDATESDGRVTLRVDASDEAVVLEVSDTGSGMSAEFVRERLFRPFDSTKGSKGMGIGVYQVREYVRSIGGDIEVQSSTGSGTSFRISLPRCPSRTAAGAAVVMAHSGAG